MNKAMEKNPVAEARRWHQELKFAKKEDGDWIKRGKKIVKRYRDDRTAGNSGVKRYNIFWSNVQTVLPALYGRTPRAQVERRWKDKDPVSRTAATILERALQYEIDHYGDYDFAVKAAVGDRLLPGRGVAWVRFETKSVETVESPEMQAAEDSAPEMQEGMNYGEPSVEMYAGQPEINVETTPVDYVYWEDFRCTPARTWDEVTWVARRVYMTKDAVIKRFGEEFSDVNLSHVPTGLDDMKSQGVSQTEIDRMKKAEVWEIWDKDEECVYWVADGYDKLLDHKDDPYGLDGFWPCPKPLFATQTTDQLVPVPDFSLYQDQADEIDKLTNRIGLLVDAVKVVGVYDASQPSIQRMLNEGVDNTLIPVDSWAAFSEKGGIKGTVDFLPIQEVMQALNECYKAREAAKQVVYDVTGLSDIIRGSSVASETATAQQIKGQYASMRLKRMQHDVAVFASELLKIKAQLMCDLYSPQNLIEMSGIMGTDDAMYAEQAIQLMKSEPVRSFRIEVASDSLVEMDEAGEKAARTEFLQAFGQAMGQALPIIQQAPEFAPLIGETLQFVVRTFKGGRQLENALEMAIEKGKEPKPQQPNPEMLKMQQDQQAQQALMMAEQQKAQIAQQLEQAKLQASAELEQFKAQTAMQLEQMKQAAETERATYRAQLEAQTKLEIAQINADASTKPVNQFTVDSGGKLDNIAETITSAATQQGAGIAEAVNTLAQVSAALVDSVAEMKKPKKMVLIRDELTGKAIGSQQLVE
jgi:methylphosphotriester-DNA--protein-cysteine methyltransferase